MSPILLLEQWLSFSEDVEPKCAAGHDLLDDLRTMTKLYLETIKGENEHGT